MEQENMLHLMKYGISCIQMFGSGQDVDSISDEQFRSTIKTFLLDPSQFVAGNMRHHLPAWKKWFSKFGLTSKAGAVLQWIEHGVSFDVVHPCSAVQQRRPRFAERLQLVKELLSITVIIELVNALLEREAPRQVHFANRVSCAY